MKAIHLTAPKTLALVEKAELSAPGAGEVLIQVKAVGICGSDLYMFGTGAIGCTRIEEPFTLGHEFMGEVIAVGEDSESGTYEGLTEGQRVAVEPSVSCLHCEVCEAGHPNHYFFGVFPTHGALCEKMIVPARNCFCIPDEISDGAGTLLETLGVAIHAVDLAKLKLAKTVAVIGCGRWDFLFSAWPFLVEHERCMPWIRCLGVPGWPNPEARRRLGQ